MTADVDEHECVWVGKRPIPVALTQGGRFKIAGEITDTAMVLLRTGRLLPRVADEDVGEAVLATVGGPGVKVVKDFQRNQLIGVSHGVVGEILVGPITQNPDGTLMLRLGLWVASERVMVVPVRKGLSCFGITPP